MERKFFRYLPEYNAFGIADEEVKDLFCLELDADAYARLGVSVPDEEAPKIAFLSGREEGHYTIDFSYAYAIAQTGARIILLDYAHYVHQLHGCHGLVLPGGAFASPKQYYVEEMNKSLLPEPGARSWAYVQSYHWALMFGIPVLGICAGAQIIAGECGGLLYPNESFLSGTILHKTKEMQAHEINIVPGSFLHKLLRVLRLVVNSRHKETLAEMSPVSGFEIYAQAPDGVPEAWGSRADHILCVQWHPEDYVVAGDKRHARIYEWLTDEAVAFQRSCI